MSKLVIEQCPETGICSIAKKDVGKVDLLSVETDQIKDNDDNEKIKEIIAQCDPKFAEQLDQDDIQQIRKEII